MNFDNILKDNQEEYYGPSFGAESLQESEYDKAFSYLKSLEWFKKEFVYKYTIGYRLVFFK